ncbi:TonB-dependent receptor [Chryseobacterium sp.]|uniref:TonB-dependent receptor domain-containing protein n=1 Tax=Chryseobacterium sp. TaxID=1871047 RepID=UPI0025B87B94|nr:TonB-dependent receptor [Chryseobacterium sp.]MBV8324837.1 TonB-dependent receptor [Chryseobacterium sp.]
MLIKLWLFLLVIFLSCFGKAQEPVKTKTPDSTAASRAVTTNISEVIIKSASRNIKLSEGNLVMSVSGNKDFKTSVSLLDVLKKTPGVTVDQEDGIFIGGRISPAIFIDGKPVIMSNQELQAYLRSLPPEMVTSVEVNTNPSSKYDAEFNGIIDIRLKKNVNPGWKGNYNGTLYVNKFNYRENSFNVSYHTGKVTYNLLSGYSDGISTYRYNALQRLANTNIMRTQTYQKDNAGIYNVQAGADFRLNDHHRIGVSLRGNFRKNDRDRSGSLYATDKKETLLILNTENKNPMDYSQDNFGITTDYSFQNKGFKISFSGNYLSVKNKQKDDFINREISSSALLSYWKSDLLNKIDIYTGQTDISQKIGNADFEAGIKYSHSDTHNNIRYDTLSADHQFLFDSSRSNVFAYKEKIWAGYLAYRQKFGKLQMNAGLRVENTYSLSNAVTVDSVVSRNYTEWLPSFNAAYTFNTANEFSVSYSRRITRPVFSQLNPFRFYFSPLNYWIGNPYLLPSLTSQIKATYRYKNWITSFTIGKETDVMTRYPLYNSKTNVLEYLGTNLPYRKFAVLETSFPLKIAKWWNMTGQFAGYYNNEFRPYLDEVFKMSVYNYEIRLNQIFTLPKRYTINLFAAYESKTGNSLYVIKPRYTIDVSIQKSWFDNKLNTKMGYNNIFDSYDQRLEFRYKQIMDNRFTHWWDSSRFFFTLSYNFGSSDYQVKETQRSEEENRAR